jgi:hypothetical protein
MTLMAIFDKSFLQSLNHDEAAIFDALFMTNITPVFFVETLADLEKEMKKGRTAEDVVGGLAAKTPVMHIYPNVHYWNLCLGDLLGHEVKMRRCPVLGGAKVAKIPGKTGVLYEHPPEMQALSRWADQDFLGVERDFAKQWRAHLASVPKDTKRIMLGDGSTLKLSNLEQVKKFVDHFMRGDRFRFSILKAALTQLGIPSSYWPEIIKRWKATGGVPLPQFAPYAAHVLSVDLFFDTAVATGHISAERASNRVDISYLYYLPFTEIFISNDNLHQRVVPFFLRDNQSFVWGADLKADLKELDAYYMQHPDIEEHGLMKVANFPPLEGNFYTSRLNDQLRPAWRGQASHRVKATSKVEKKIWDDLEAVKNAAKARPITKEEHENIQSVTIERKVPLKRGKWQFLPKGIKADVE